MEKKPSKGKGKGSGRPIPKVQINLEMSENQWEELVKTLKHRFEENINRHLGLEWSNIQAKLEANPEKMSSLYAMETTGGEPDVIGYDKKAGEYIFCDCSKESPNRRSICYDREGEKEREKKGLYPGGNAISLAAAMRIEILTEEQYRELQNLGEFDTKTSSWIKTPIEIRELGGAIFADRRFDHVFVYHNGAHSFYGARGFRGSVRV